MGTLYHFVAIYKLYRSHHPRKYALAMAYRIALQRLPF